MYAVAFRFPFTGTKGPILNCEKQPQTIIPPQLFTVGTMQVGAGRVLMALLSTFNPKT
jgi:hypothetical protein